MRVSLLSCDLLQLPPELREVARDEESLLHSLTQHGLQPQWVEWGSEEALVQASGTTVTLIRSTWNYSDSVQKKDEFVTWLKRLSKGVGKGVSEWGSEGVSDTSTSPCINTPTPSLHHSPTRSTTILMNSVELIEWNTDKHYLLQLQHSGVPIVPTRVVHRGEATPDLCALATHWHTHTLIIKPIVGASARGLSKHTLRDTLTHSDYNSSDCDENYSSTAVAHASECVEEVAECDGAALVQPFLPEIMNGELSIVCINRVPMGAVLKSPAVGDYRVQEEWGGTYTVRELTPTMVKAATRVLDAFPSGEVLYARLDFVAVGVESLFAVACEGHSEVCEDKCDCVDDTTVTYLLMEAECVEPELFFTLLPQVSDAIAKRVAEVARAATIAPITHSVET
jgi:hypothetical protein